MYLIRIEVLYLSIIIGLIVGLIIKSILSLIALWVSYSQEKKPFITVV